MSKCVLISVIIPVFNTERYLKVCLDSVISQTLSDIEIICINDGSTDSSLEILNSYAKKDSRVIVINQNNSGQSVARNKGLEVANGECIAFLDSDDWMEPEMLEKLYKNAKSNNSDVAMCSIAVNNEATSKKTCNDCYLSLDIFDKSFDNRVFAFNDIKDFIFRICVAPWNKIYKRSFLKENRIKFAENINFEDNIFNLEILLKAQRISLIRDCLVNYRYFSETSYSTGNGKNDYKKLDFFKIFDIQKAILKRNDKYEIIKSYFEQTKKNNLKYWYDKTTNPYVKLIYGAKLFFSFPSLAKDFFLKQSKNNKIISKINSLLSQNKKIVFRGATLQLEEILNSKKLNNKQNIIGIIDKNPEKIGKLSGGILISDYELLKNNKIDLLILSNGNIHNFDKIVETELSELGLHVDINSNIF